MYNIIYKMMIPMVLMLVLIAALLIPRVEREKQPVELPLDIKTPALQE